VVYAGYGMQKQLQFYSLAQRKVLRTVTLTHWASALDLAPSAPLLAVGVNGEYPTRPIHVRQDGKTDGAVPYNTCLCYVTERLLKLMDYFEGSFQDFVGHDDALRLVKFSPDGKSLFSATQTEILQWQVVV